MQLVPPPESEPVPESEAKEPESEAKEPVLVAVLVR